MVRLLMLLVVLWTAPTAAQQYQRYIRWQQAYDGNVYAWMSPDVYQELQQVGIYAQGTAGAVGPMTVRTQNGVFRATYHGRAEGGLIVLRLDPMDSRVAADVKLTQSPTEI